MNQSRRHFLRSSSLLATSLPLMSFTAAKAGAVEKSSTEKDALPKGLLFAPEEKSRILANFKSERFAAVAKDVFEPDFQAETAFLERELRVTNHALHLARARRTMETAALAFTLTGDERQLALSKLALRRLCDFPKWDYFLDGGKAVVGIQRAADSNLSTALTLDWLGDALSAEERERAEHDIGTKGAPACYLSLYGMKHPDRVRGWAFDPEDEYPHKYDMSRWPIILNSTNLKAIPTAGLGVAACVLRGKHPQAERWLEMARNSARSFALMFNSDGSYDEGVGYASYAASHIAVFTEVLWRTQGIDDRSIINYPGVVEMMLAMSMPTAGAPTKPAGERNIVVPHETIQPAYDIVNFGDSGVGLDVLIAPWVARTNKDKLSQHVATNIGFYKSHLGAIWYDRSLPAEAPPSELMDVRMNNDWVVSRSGWGTSDGVVALRSGGPANHEHADRNSVIFKAHGERLFHDPFRAAYSPDVQRWKLRQTSAHTALLIDGVGHQYHDGREGVNSSWAWARVQSYHTGKDWMSVTSDATEAYALIDESVLLVERTLIYLKPDILLMLDRVKLKERPRPVQVRFQVYNDDGQGAAATSWREFTITRPHAVLTGSTHALENVVTRIGRLDLPESDGVFPFIEATSPAATGHVVLTASVAAPAGEKCTALNVIREGDAWRVTGEHRGQKVTVFIIVADGKPPVITV
ncbi:hypothetical protein CMV30_11890 [Nibricoccus aquaticus]|uniref:Heparinase II/III-like C-terminal domain-containing protein n=1 Tax=Nibricoccus aquaticus TaxID=2576891 RepID=A0A290Q7G9_9BACT|nr:heparinase II/III family protein [Nibricoccus aquaticus]ATC64599.1 hypothetical protein CMV30_11890 [Nibricoccus aquaticus]